MSKTHILSYAYLITTMMFWAGTFISGKLLADSIHPVISSFMRFTFGTLALAIFLLILERKIVVPTRKEWLQLIILALTGPVGFNLFFFTGLQHIEAGRAAIIVSLNPLAITVYRCGFTR